MPDTLNTPDGERAEENELVTTDRTKQRDEEDERFVPVIVKRTDESRRHPDDMLEHAVKDGLEQIRRRGVSLTLSATAGGMILGFTAMPVAVVAKTVAEGPWAGFSRILMALAYPLGFVICILSGAQLFTEHTATAVYPVLDGKASARELLRLWLIVIVGNLLGAGIIATLLSLAEPVIAAHEGYEIVGRHLVAYPPLPLLNSAILAGWLMAQGGWLVLATADTTGQILCVYIATFVIGMGGFHHSIAGSVEILTACLVSTRFTVTQAAASIGMSLLGNLIGGSAFVALLNYVHIRGTQKDK